MKRIPVLVVLLLLASCAREPSAVLQEAAEAMGTGDFRKAEQDFRWLLERTPDDAKLQANLAFALTRQGKHQEALKFYKALVGDGEGTYDLFAFYAKSLDATGRGEDAILWNYRALSVVPQLVDVRGDLAKQLVKHARPFEALALLSSFDDRLETQGQNPYFEGQRIAIASELPAPVSPGSGESLRAVRMEGHFYTVAIGNEGTSMPLLVDTGASHTTCSPEALRALKLGDLGPPTRVRLQTADGREVSGREFTVPEFRVGPYALQNVKVVTCDHCAPLLGQSTLERFDLKTTKVDGLEVMTMSLRP